MWTLFKLIKKIIPSNVQIVLEKTTTYILSVYNHYKAQNARESQAWSAVPAQIIETRF